MANLMLFCLVEGDPTSKAFEVEIPKTCTVSSLRDKIKERKPNYCEKIDADELTLWKVALIAPDSEEPISVDIFKHAKKLLPREVLSSVFTGPPDGDTYIIVQRPPSATQNDPEVAMLRKQLSDMEKTNAELRSTSISLGIIDKRRGKRVVCQYVTDIKTATLVDLRQLLQKHIDQFEGDEYVQIFVYAGGTSPVLLTTDYVLRSTLELAQQKGWRNLTVSLDSPAKNFSSYTWKDVMSLYEVGNIPELLPTFHIQPKPLTEEEMEVLEHIVKDCTFKNKAYVFGSGASEATKSTIVDAFMVGAMQFYKSEMLLAQQHQMSGQRGHGPVDFAVIDRKFQTQVLGVTEVKKDDHVQGLAQNMVQLDVAVHHKKRKRAEEADEDIDERAPVRFKSYGIVTDSFKWVIVECTSENDTVTFRTKEALDHLQLKGGENALREGCKIVFGYVLALYELMKDEIMNRSSCTMSRSTSAKRFAGEGSA